MPLPNGGIAKREYQILGAKGCTSPQLNIVGEESESLL